MCQGWGVFTSCCVIDKSRGLSTGVFRAFSVSVYIACQFQSFLGFWMTFVAFE